MNLMNIEQNAENLRLLGLIVAQRGETIYQHQLGQPVPPPAVLRQQELHRGGSRFRGSGGVIAP